MKVYQLYTHLVRSFKRYSIPEPESSALNIIQKSLEIPYRSVYTKTVMFSQCSKPHINVAQAMLKKRRTLMPIQYVIGEWEFRDLYLKMKRPVLIPRPETSGLVDLVQKFIPKCNLTPLEKQRQNSFPLKFLEIGCGSGAICLSLLKDLALLESENNIFLFYFQKKEQQNFHGTAIDLKLPCVELTRVNAKLNQIQNIQVIQASWETYYQMLIETNMKFNFIVSNPPYIPSSQISSLDPSVKNFEDHVALDGGADGLNLIKNILDNAHNVLLPGGFLALEVDVTHNRILQEMFEKSDINSRNNQWKEFYSEAKFFKDMYERDRFCIFIKK